jgi:endonuclease I
MKFAPLVFLFLVVGARADYQAPDPAYNPPASYYNNAVGAGATLRMNLHNIITAGFTGISYGDARYILDDLDQDPNNAANVLLVYNRASVSEVWNPSVSWNREHLWPQSKLGVNVDNPYIGPGSDLFELRPCNPGINSSRSNDAYGATTSTGPYQNSSGFFYAGDADKGDVARAIFYMATRYYNGSGVPSTNNLSIVSGYSIATYQMGDLQALLKWHYTDGADNFERRRNDLIFDNYQHNRNPFIDHPEYVWAVFGGSANTSQISVATPATNGSSSTVVDLGTFFVNGTIPTANVAIAKTGATPTTYDIAVAGSATTTATGVGQAFDYNNVTRNILVGLISGSNTTAGLKTGTVTVHNTDLTSAATGQGAADQDDSINVSATVLARANGSLSNVADANSSGLNFGVVYVGSGLQSLPFEISNLESAVGFTAKLDLLGESGIGATTTLTTDLAPFNGLTAGSSQMFNASINTSTAGNFAATYNITVSDDTTIPGALAQQLVLNLSGSVEYRRGDFTIDGVVTDADISAMLRALADLGDYQATKSLTPAALLAIGDFSGDGHVNNRDIQSLLNLIASAGSGAVAAVPEPAGIVLLTFGGTIALLCFRHSRGRMVSRFEVRSE